MVNPAGTQNWIREDMEYFTIGKWGMYISDNFYFECGFNGSTFKDALKMRVTTAQCKSNKSSSL